MNDAQDKSLLTRLLMRVFPATPDFFTMLAEQSAQVERTVDLLVKFMLTDDPAIGERIREDEHAADTVKVRNIHTLNEAFSTPIDREDIYRAITTLDEVINYCKDAVNEMHAMNVKPDDVTLEMATLMHEGMLALRDGYAVLGTRPAEAATFANIARKAERKVEKLYRRALAELFNGDDFRHMFKHREIYRHLTDGAECMADCANTLHDIVVKMV